jgi:hypothetical protein
MNNDVSREVQRLIREMPRGTQSLLAQAAGVSSATVTKWKIGQTTPHPEVWPTLVEYFGLDANHFTVLAEDGQAVGRRLDQLQAAIDRQQSELDALRRSLGIPRAPVEPDRPAAATSPPRP